MVATSVSNTYTIAFDVAAGYGPWPFIAVAAASAADDDAN